MNQNGRYLLDTNIVIALFAEEEAVQERIGNADGIALAPPIIGELRYGAQKSNRVAENHRKIDQLVEESTMFSCNLETAWWYGVIRDKLRRKGHPIPDNDIWIAAIAMQHGLTVVTRDAHFEEIDALQVERW